MELTPTELSAVILTIVGIVLQLLLKRAGKFAEWYQARQDKGTIAVAFALGVSILYFAFSCTPLAADLGIAVSCTRSDAFLVAKAFYLILVGQQGTYLLMRNSR